MERIANGKVMCVAVTIGNQVFSLTGPGFEEIASLCAQHSLCDDAGEVKLIGQGDWRNCLNWTQMRDKLGRERKSYV